jgi:hypothetical protein
MAGPKSIYTRLEHHHLGTSPESLPVDEQPLIVHLFSAAVRWNLSVKGNMTDVKLQSEFNLSAQGVTDMGAIRTHYATLTDVQKASYLHDIETGFHLLAAGMITETECKLGLGVAI